jgi:hypothetical protein
MPDAKAVVAFDAKTELPTRYPVDRSAPIAVAGGVRGDRPLARTDDGASIWVLNRRQVPAQIFRIDLTTGRRTYWRDAPYPDPASIEPPSLRLYMSADGSKLVYGYQSHLSELYLATGLR